MNWQTTSKQVAIQPRFPSIEQQFFKYKGYYQTDRQTDRRTHKRTGRQTERKGIKKERKKEQVTPN